MARTTPGVTRQRLLDQALHLFATRGYAATSVADIQSACGLAPGSGALYKHFPSKRALLEEAVRRNLDKIADRAPADAELPDLARTVWEVLDEDRDLVRIMLRDFDVLPEVFERLWTGVAASVYGAGAAWVAARHPHVEDPEATAAVLLASLTYFPLLHSLIGHTPGDVPPDRFLRAWTAHARATLTPPGAA